jgi:hypothetical protein
MATVDSSKFTNPTYPRRASHGVTCVYSSETIATTSLNESTQADRVRLIPLPDKVKLIGFFITHADLDDGSALDADIVLNDDDSDVILFNAGSGFQSARTTPLWVDCARVQVNAQGDTKASLDFLVNTAAGTPAAGALTITLFYDGAPD